MRRVDMTDEQYEVLDKVVVPALMRSGDQERASQMMTLALAFKFAPEPQPVRDANVVDLFGHSRKVPA